MKYKFFGKNISPDCSYCVFSGFENGIIACKKSKHMKDGRCRSFSYDPLLRVPTSVSISGRFTADDFKL